MTSHNTSTGTPAQRVPRAVAPWVAWVLVGSGLAVFVGVWVWMASGASSGIDSGIHEWFAAHRTGVVTGLMVVLSHLFGSVGGTVLVVVVAVLLGRTYRPDAALLVGAVVTGVVVSTVLKHIIDRARPVAELRIGPDETAPSFPSGHTLFAAVLVLVAGYLWWRRTGSRGRLLLWGMGGGGVVLLVAVSRLYLGVHWLTDTVASMGLGVMILGVVMAVDARIRVAPWSIETSPATHERTPECPESA